MIICREEKFPIFVCPFPFPICIPFLLQFFYHSTDPGITSLHYPRGFCTSECSLCLSPQPLPRLTFSHSALNSNPVPPVHARAHTHTRTLERPPGVAVPWSQQHHNCVSVVPPVTMETSVCRRYRQTQPLQWLVPVNPHVSVCA